jgi:hypothetical protein
VLIRVEATNVGLRYMMGNVCRAQYLTFALLFPDVTLVHTLHTFFLITLTYPKVSPYLSYRSTIDHFEVS